VKPTKAAVQVRKQMFYYSFISDHLQNSQSSFSMVIVTSGGMAVTRLVFTDSRKNVSSFSRTASSTIEMPMHKEKLDTKTNVKFCVKGM
jgi:hypothetical protein